MFRPDNPYMAPVASAAERTFPIGKLVDSADDMARLMIVTQYAGTNTVKVYNAGAELEMGTKVGVISIMTLAGERREQRGSEVRGHLLCCWSTPGARP